MNLGMNKVLLTFMEAPRTPSPSKKIYLVKPPQAAGVTTSEEE